MGRFPGFTRGSGDGFNQWVSTDTVAPGLEAPAGVAVRPCYPAVVRIAGNWPAVADGWPTVGLDGERPELRPGGYWPVPGAWISNLIPPRIPATGDLTGVRSSLEDGRGGPGSLKAHEKMRPGNRTDRGGPGGRVL